MWKDKFLIFTLYFTGLVLCPNIQKYVPGGTSWGERFGPLLKYIIQKSGLFWYSGMAKPVQRQFFILWIRCITHDKGYRRIPLSLSANIISPEFPPSRGTFHLWCHGPACLRTGRTVRSLWKCTETMVSWTVIHHCVTMRYTEARLSGTLVIFCKISKRIQCHFAWNFDIEKEQTVLPIAFPNITRSMVLQGFQLVTQQIFRHLQPLLKSSMPWSTWSTSVC